MSKKVKGVGVFKTVDFCPFDDLPCDHVGSCDDVLHLALEELLSHDCSRAVVGIHSYERAVSWVKAHGTCF